MKFNTGIIILATQLASVLAGVAPSPAALEECGDLGVLTYTDASLAGKGVDATAVRTCKEHPLGLNPRPEAPSGGSSASKRHESDLDSGDLLRRQAGVETCWYGDSYGCSKGYCWKVCGEGGRWCWTAWNKGWGSWRTCSSMSDCKDTDQAECGEGGCKACGCSC